VFHVWRYFNDCLSAVNYRVIQGPETIFLYITSESDLITYISDLLDWGVNVNIKGGKFNYTLAAAAWHGHETTARLLL